VHSLTCSLSCSHSSVHSLTCSLSCSHSPMHPLLICALTNTLTLMLSLTYAPTTHLTCSLSCSHSSVHSLTCALTNSLTCALTSSLTCILTNSLTFELSLNRALRALTHPRTLLSSFHWLIYTLSCSISISLSLSHPSFLSLIVCLSFSLPLSLTHSLVGSRGGPEERIPPPVGRYLSIVSLTACWPAVVVPLTVCWPVPFCCKSHCLLAGTILL
jgi:hypothetical protein